jgi:tetratricopeptide (TPR) repeat protein
VLGHYVHSAGHADRLLDPHRDEPPTLTALPAGVEPERPAGREQALVWFDAERRVLISALHQSAEFDAQVWELAWTTRRFLAHQGHWHDEMVASSAALAAAERLDDPLRQAFAYAYAGCTHVWLGNHEEARGRFDVALRLYEEAGDDVGQANVVYFYSWMLDRQGRDTEALPHAERALSLYRSAGHQTGEAKVLNAIGWFHALAGDYSVALDHCEKALAVQTAIGDRLASGQTWHSLGYVHEHLGDNAQAIACYRAAADLFHDAGYRIIEARVLRSLGETYLNDDDVEPARAALRQAVRILDEFDHPDADEIRTVLKGIP